MPAIATIESSDDLPRGFLLRLKLPAILNKVSLRQLNFLTDCCPHVFDDAAEIAVGDVCLNDDAALHVLTIDRIWPLIDADFSDLAIGTFAPVGVSIRVRLMRLDGLPRRIIESDQHVISSLFFQNLRNDLTVESDIHSLGQVFGAQATAAAAGRFMLI